jgi:outer membrane receptor protein involved in Fe transport
MLSRGIDVKGVDTKHRSAAGVLMAALCVTVTAGRAQSPQVPQASEQVQQTAAPPAPVAANPPGAAADGVQLDTTVVTGHYDNGVGTSDAASQGRVTAKLIENRPILRTGEILEFIPGMIVTQHSGDGKANQYYLRGFNLDHGTDFASFVDGMPINSRSHAHGQGYTDLNFLIPELVSRIDYKKGTYYADEGDFATAGAAHIGLANKLPQGLVSLTGGSYGYQRGVVANSTSLGAGNLLYGLELGRNNGPWDVPENIRRAAGVVRYSQGQPNDGFSVTAMGYDAKWTSTDQIPQRAIDQGIINRFGSLDPTDGGKTSRYSLSFDWAKRGENSLTRFNAYAVQSKLNLFSNFTFLLDDPVNGDQFEQAERRQTFGFDFSHTWFGKLGGFDTSNRIGLQTRYDKLDPVALYSTAGQQILSTTSSTNVKESSIALYFENTTNWTEKFRTIAGLRTDRFDFDVASDIAENSGKVSSSITSPKLSLIFGPWSKTEVFLNYGEGFHSNDARGTTEHVTPKELLPADPVTPLVKAKGAEIGLRTQIIPGLESSIAFWQLKLDSELLFIGDAGDTEASRASLRRGIEWNNHYVATPWLLFDLDLALSRTRFTQFDPAGDHVPGSVERVGSFGVSVTDLGPWFGAFQYRYFGPRPLTEDNSVRSQSTSIANLRVGYKVDKNWKVTLDVLNLFNRKQSDIDYFYASRLAGEPPEGVDDVHFHPSEPRVFRLTLTARF